jgi:hypothetical protein
MKSLKRLALGGIALLMLGFPMTAQAQGWGYRHADGCGWRHRDIAWDRHNLHSQWRDIGRDRFALRQDIANGNWAAARAQRADIAQDYMNVRHQRWDLYHDYSGGQPGYLPPASYGMPPRTAFLPPATYAMPPRTAFLPPATYAMPPRTAFLPPATYPQPVNQVYPGAYSSYPVNNGGANGQGLGALLGNILP